MLQIGSESGSNRLHGLRSSSFCDTRRASRQAAYHQDDIENAILTALCTDHPRLDHVEILEIPSHMSHETIDSQRIPHQSNERSVIKLFGQGNHSKSRGPQSFCPFTTKLQWCQFSPKGVPRDVHVHQFHRWPPMLQLTMKIFPG